MATNETFGINFPFRNSSLGKYLSLSKDNDQEIRSSLLHLILTRKGSRYMLPNFGTRIYEFIFDPMDGQTFDAIKEDIQQACDLFIPDLNIISITLTPYVLLPEKQESQRKVIFNPDDFVSTGTYFEQFETINSDVELQDVGIYRLPGKNTEEYTAKLKIEYTIDNNPFGSKQFVIINI
jgi:phage baseplate assembly protein W